MLFQSIVYGPIHSRRLGVSLGMELMPLEHKLCTFNCVYCECGWNQPVAHPQLPSRAEVREALEAKRRARLKELEELIEQRRSYVYDRPDSPKLYPIEGLDKPALAAVPIISAGDVIGAVALISTAGEPKADEKNLMLAKAAAMFLGKQIEN
jgi:hypothetical protein